MVTKKKVAKKKVSKKKVMAKRGGSNSMVSVKDRMAAMTEEQNLAEGGEGNFISTKNSEFSYRGTDMGTELSVIILAYCHDYTYYDSKYDADNPGPPACFAVGDMKPRDLVPHEDSPSPQADECDSCQLNEFGSDGGKGKVCRNHYRLAIIPSDSDYTTAEIAFVRIAPTGYSKYGSYVRGLKKKHGIPPIGCITTLSFMEEVDYPSVICDMEELIDDEEQLEILLGRNEEACDAVTVHGYAVDQYEPPRASKVSKKKVSKKKAVARRR